MDLEMKELLYLILFFCLGFSSAFEEPPHRKFEDGGVEIELERELMDAKFDLLTEYVAREWGYRDSDRSLVPNSYYISADEYLEKASNLILSKHNLTLKQKVEGLKIGRVLKTFNWAISYDEQAKTARRNLPENNPLVLKPLDISVDLLLQSFSPIDFHDHINCSLSEEAQRNYRRNVGVITLIRKLGHAAFPKDNIVTSTFYQLHPRQLQQHVNSHLSDAYVANDVFISILGIGG